MKLLQLYNVGINYKKADTYTRGLFSISKENQIALLKEAKKRGIEALFVLSTCNRTEIMGFAHNPYELISLLVKYCKGDVETFSKVASIYKGEEAHLHLFQTAVGLNSQILGDHEIIGQLKTAFNQAKDYDLINTYLDRLFSTVLQASKEIKSSTYFSTGTTSVAFAAIQYLQKNIPDCSHKKMVIYGLGEMGKKTCQYLLQEQYDVCLINRSLHKAEEFQKQFPALAISDEKTLISTIQNSDILIVATGSDLPTIRAEHIDFDKKLVILDLSIPENVAPELKHYPNIELINVDMLSKVTDENLENRKQSIPFVEETIQKYQNEFSRWLYERQLSPTINNFKQSLLEIKEKEIHFLSQKYDDFNREYADILSDRMIQKMMAQLVQYLKNEQAVKNDPFFANNKNET
ncbi:Glutamyl-tRNA reductase [Phocoenobacter uteri]|uniref:Glutamyl-tRNA reductase n=1 Tax=Phocoenobacter uteri TaxID=146806 RepID=A0A379C9L9_9PAST|nr:glutamyl-tRNA reductase [Phocoenobacter uteri]MDG6882278.1 glutamyl-tRNA reductase [Phocoenobacter uteri]SUB58435.1 Glutamyl-tRNA reductase [Phocoenobacter uteri]